MPWAEASFRWRRQKRWDQITATRADTHCQWVWVTINGLIAKTKQAAIAALMSCGIQSEETWWNEAEFSIHWRQSYDALRMRFSTIFTKDRAKGDAPCASTPPHALLHTHVFCLSLVSLMSVASHFPSWIFIASYFAPYAFVASHFSPYIYAFALLHTFLPTPCTFVASYSSPYTFDVWQFCLCAVALPHTFPPTHFLPHPFLPTRLPRPTPLSLLVCPASYFSPCKFGRVCMKTNLEVCGGVS